MVESKTKNVDMVKCSKEGMHVKSQSREQIGKAFRGDVRLHKGGDESLL